MSPVTQDRLSEWGLFVVRLAAGCVGRPRCRRGRRGPRIVAGETAAVGRSTGGAETATSAGATRHPLHLGGGVPQRRADLVDLELVHGPLLALAGLVRPLLQPTLDNHPGAPRERLGDVLRRLAPHVAGQEQRVAVLPLTGLLVQEPRRGRDAELRDRGARRGEAQLRIVDQVADDRDYGVSCHGLLPVISRVLLRPPPRWISYSPCHTGVTSRRNTRSCYRRSGRITLVRSTDSLSRIWRSSSATAAGSACRSITA